MLQTILLGYKLISLKPYSIVLLEIMKQSKDTRLIAVILNCMMIESISNKEIVE